MAQILVGTASWTDKSLIEAGTFYPEKSMTAEGRLRQFATCHRCGHRLTETPTRLRCSMKNACGYSQSLERARGALAQSGPFSTPAPGAAAKRTGSQWPQAIYCSFSQCLTPRKRSHLDLWHGYQNSFAPCIRERPRKGLLKQNSTKRISTFAIYGVGSARNLRSVYDRGCVVCVAP